MLRSVTCKTGHLRSVFRSARDTTRFRATPLLNCVVEICRASPFSSLSSERFSRFMSTTASQLPLNYDPAITSGAHIPVWMMPETYPNRKQPDYPKIDGDYNTDVCVIGGGISGLTTAYFLLKAGKGVVLLEDGEIASAESGRTTAHLMSAVDDRYFMVESIHGRRAAQIVKESHCAAIDMIESICKEENIDCEFERLDGYLFLADTDRMTTLEKELRAAENAGWTNVRIVDKVPIPADRDLGPALVFPNQGQFHPLKYYDGLARAVTRLGGKIFTRSHASEMVGGSTARVKTSDGRVVQCNQIVVATNQPVNDRVTMWTKIHAWRSFVVTATIPKKSFVRALYWDTSEPYNYVRCTNYNDTHDILIIGGADRKTGQIPDYQEPYRNLEQWARARWPDMGPILQRWSGQVMETVDLLAYLGRNPSDKDNVYIITGDSGTGMTHGTIGARLITDLIRGCANHEWAKLYDPARIPPIKATQDFIEENVSTGLSYKDWLTRGEVADIEDIPVGEGRLIRHGLSKVAAYRSPDGKVFQCSAVCPHLKAIVRWNSDEKTWDCPAHGSRFNCYGHVINGPANEDLAPYNK